MKIGYVTPRYGPEVIGGAEGAVRMLAERLVRAGDEVHVFTSCALSSRSWSNELTAGSTAINGVNVNRFACGGRAKDFDRLSEKLQDTDVVTEAQHREWLTKQGPSSKELVDAATSAQLDVLVGYPYLYEPIVDSLLAAKCPTILHPAAHDEWFLDLPVFKSLFQKADALVFQTDAERRLCETRFDIKTHRQLRLGLGVEPIEVSDSDRKNILSKIGLDDAPYLLYLGRVDDGKGVGALAKFFVEYKKRRPSDLRLVLAGPILDRPIANNGILALGEVDEVTKWALLGGARSLVSASPWEAFGLVIVEAWTAHTPVIVNRYCAAFSELVGRSGGGLEFSGYAEFEASVDAITADPSLSVVFADRGFGYAGRHFSWGGLIERYRTFLSGLIAQS